VRRAAAQALGFLTPLGGPSVPSPGALAWFPVVGAGLGLALGGIWLGATELWPAPVAAALVVGADLALTGMLHLDGLVDAADGLLPHLERSRRLEVMADPAAGAFGVGTAVALLLLRWAVLASLAPSAALIGCLWCGSRFVMAVASTRMHYARPGGLAESFVGGGRAARPGLVGGLVGGLVLGAALGALGRPHALLGLVVLGLSSAAVLGLADRRLGGFTGDVLGAAGLVGETFGLLAAAARR
jgi:adenosylcobinamide-GDP ribazoletransferase